MEMMPDKLRLYGEINYGIGFIIFNRRKFINGGGLSIFCSINEDGGELGTSLGSMHFWIGASLNTCLTTSSVVNIGAIVS